MKTKIPGILITIVALIFILAGVMAIPFLLPDVSVPDDPVAPPADDVVVERGIAVAGTTLTDASGKAEDIYIYPNKSIMFEIVGIDYEYYAVSIVPNSDASETFEFYTESGQLKSFFMLGDLTSGFDLVKNKDSFTITIPEKGMIGVLEKVYKSNVVLTEDVPSGDLFTAIITFDKATTLVLNFHIAVYPDGVEIDKTEVIF